MFDLERDPEHDATPKAEVRDEANVDPMSMQPASLEESIDLMANQSEWAEESVDRSPPPDTLGSLPEGSSRPSEMPIPSRGRSDQARDDDARKLVIGRGIVLKGEINSCDLVVVEGRLEATMKDCLEIKITETGAFRGRVEFERADISGIFEGELTAREHLVVRATGRVTGRIRFGELEIERGGQVSGDVGRPEVEADHRGLEGGFWALAAGA